MKKPESILQVHAGQEHALIAGGYSIHQYKPGKYWLENPEGEGMETSEEKVKQMLEEFFQREFCFPLDATGWSLRGWRK